MFANTWSFETVGNTCAANSEIPSLKYRPRDGQYLLVLVEFLRPSRQIPRLYYTLHNSLVILVTMMAQSVK
jgi:hypothetical protein